jgi:glycoside/pentoside/hexuronide:cation symporter, GPH family
MFAIKGFCFGAFQFLPLAMLADIVDVDTARSGEQRTGLIFALAGMTQKLALALGIGLSLPLLQLSGFDATTAHESEHLLALRFLYVLAPVLFWFGAFWIAWNYPLTADRQARIRSWIERRRSRAGDALAQ